MFRAVPAAALFALAAYSTPKAPITGYIGDEPAQGQAEARFSGNGTFSVSTTSGLTCSGTYDSMDTNPTITAPLSCSDGRQGRAIITRAPNMMSGNVIAELDDGTKGRFVFGNLAFQQGDSQTVTVTY